MDKINHGSHGNTGINKEEILSNLSLAFGHPKI